MKLRKKKGKIHKRGFDVKKVLKYFVIAVVFTLLITFSALVIFKR